MENTINTWAEAIAALPDKDFFNIMRLYLGKIKTPYNKQRLAGQLASFLNAPANTSAILSLLTPSDIEIISAVHVMQGITKENLIQFFSDSYKLSEFYTRLSNLEERLLIYKVYDEEKISFFMNPILLPALKNRLSVHNLIGSPSVVSANFEDIFILNPNFLLSFICCFRTNVFTLKNDGSLKKNCISRLEEVFPSKIHCIELLTSAFLNLSIFHEGKKRIEIDEQKLQKFAMLSELQQYALLCAAAPSHLSREGLRKQTQLLLDCLASIPDSGFTKKSILRLAFILGTKNSSASPVAAKGRFAQILEAARTKDNSESVQNMSVIERMIETAEQFGLIQNIGKDENGETIYKSGCQSFSKNTGPLSSQNPAQKNTVHIESTFSISLMPGLSLNILLPLSKFLEAKNYGIVCQFELTRDSATNAFDAGISSQDIFATLSDFSNYEIPQNLKINIQEWYNSHSSAVLYQGFVLKVSEENLSFAENNPNIQKYVQEKIADGIYLLNLPADTDIQAFLEECGLTTIKNVRTARQKVETLGFPLLKEGNASLNLNQNDFVQQTSDEEAEKLLLRMQEKLDTLTLDKNQKENLQKRINNRLIITETQLSAEAIRTEILEADGMDFAGKMHLIDAAIKEGDMLEIQMPDARGKDLGYVTIVGKPDALVRSPDDAIFTLQIDEEQEPQHIYVSHITHLRRLHF